MDASDQVSIYRIELSDGRVFHVSETMAGAYATLKLFGRYLFRGPWSNDITDNIIVQQLEWSGPWSEVA